MHVVESYLCQEAAKLASRESDNGQVMAVHVLESATHTQLTQEPLSQPVPLFLLEIAPFQVFYR